MMIQVVARSVVKEEYLERYMETATLLMEKTRAESGCVYYDLVRSRDNKNAFAFIEKWEDMESLEKHLASPHYKELVPQLNEMRESGEVDIYEPVVKE